MSCCGTNHDMRDIPLLPTPTPSLQLLYHSQNNSDRSLAFANYLKQYSRSINTAQAFASQTLSNDEVQLRGNGPPIFPMQGGFVNRKGPTNDIPEITQCFFTDSSTIVQIAIQIQHGNFSNRKNMNMDMPTEMFMMIRIEIKRHHPFYRLVLQSHQYFARNSKTMIINGNQHQFNFQQEMDEYKDTQACMIQE